MISCDAPTVVPEEPDTAVATTPIPLVKYHLQSVLGLCEMNQCTLIAMDLVRAAAQTATG